VTLTDQFGTETVEVRQAKRLCTPVDKNDEDPAAPSSPAHLTAYKIKGAKPSVADQLVTNQFGSLTVSVSKPEFLLVPTAKGLAATPPPFTELTDHYKCYRVKRALFRLGGIKVDDQFGTLTAEIKKPARLCTPVSKNGGNILDPANHLLCYKIKSNIGSPTSGSVFTRNQFETDSFTLRGPRELCVPSLKGPVTTSSTSTTSTSTTTP
jgi:hypothetical protein